MLSVPVTWMGSGNPLFWGFQAERQIFNFLVCSVVKHSRRQLAQLNLESNGNSFCRGDYLFINGCYGIWLGLALFYDYDGQYFSRYKAF